MTKFEERGISFLQDAITPEEAKRSFKRSCDICCCMPGLRIDCDNCAICLAHQSKMEYFSSFAPKGMGV